jgi:hypothetical protein
VTPDAMISGWYYAKAGAPVGHEIGPLSWEELYLLAQDGTLAPADLVWNPKLPRGVTAGQVPGLFASVAIPEPQPVAAAPTLQLTPKIALEEPGEPIPPAEPVQPEPHAALPQPVEPIATETAPAYTTASAAEDLEPLLVADDELSTEGSEALARVEPTGGEPPKPSRSVRHAHLPWLIVLLAAAIAAAGLTMYFFYLRDLWG